jgi:hypothetical protein
MSSMNLAKQAAVGLASLAFSFSLPAGEIQNNETGTTGNKEIPTAVSPSNKTAQAQSSAAAATEITSTVINNKSYDLKQFGRILDNGILLGILNADQVQTINQLQDQSQKIAELSKLCQEANYTFELNGAATTWKLTDISAVIEVSLKHGLIVDADLDPLIAVDKKTFLENAATENKLTPQEITELETAIGQHNNAIPAMFGKLVAQLNREASAINKVPEAIITDAAAFVSFLEGLKEASVKIEGRDFSIPQLESIIGTGIFTGKLNKKTIDQLNSGDHNPGTGQVEQFKTLQDKYDALAARVAGISISTTFKGSPTVISLTELNAIMQFAIEEKIKDPSQFEPIRFVDNEFLLSRYPHLAKTPTRLKAALGAAEAKNARINGAIGTLLTFIAEDTEIVMSKPPLSLKDLSELALKHQAAN